MSGPYFNLVDNAYYKSEPNLPFDRVFFYQHFLGRDNEVALVGQFLLRLVRRYRLLSGYPKPLTTDNGRLIQLNESPLCKIVDQYLEQALPSPAAGAQAQAQTFGDQAREELMGLRVVDGGCGLGRLLPLLGVSFGLEVEAIEPDLDYLAAAVSVRFGSRVAWDFLILSKQCSSLEKHFGSSIKITASAQSFETLAPLVRQYCLLPTPINLPSQAHYDLITIVNGGLYYITDFKSRLSAIRRLHACLRPGGLLVIDMANFIFHIAYTFPCPGTPLN